MNKLKRVLVFIIDCLLVVLFYVELGWAGVKKLFPLPK